VPEKEDWGQAVVVPAVQVEQLVRPVELVLVPLLAPQPVRVEPAVALPVVLEALEVELAAEPLAGIAEQAQRLDLFQIVVRGRQVFD
jgi:hypothetical protein